MKSLKITATLVTIIAILLTLISCNDLTSVQPANAEGFKAIESEIKSKFGENAYFTDLTITYNKSLGNSVSIIATKAPESLEMEQWNLTRDTWKQTSEIALEVPLGSKASDFMFQLNNKINLIKLGELVEKSSKQLIAEKNIKNPIFHMAFIKFPKNGDTSKTEYAVMLKPENGGTTFSFFYTINGDLVKVDY